MRDLGHLHAVVPASDAAERRVISLRPSGSRTAASRRATALVFEDPASLALKARLDRVAPTDASLVITGDTGTGKELVARYVHEHSKRRDGPFVAINCGALTDNLIEAELFGYERGAFTGALKTQIGWFETANGGTLLLDEIGDLPLARQVTLLRVLQEREVVRLGSRDPVPFDVRVIAATNVDLDAAVAAGQFRQDLFFRLNVAAVSLAPLKDRRGDIAPLAEHFLRLLRERIDRPHLVFDEGAAAALTGYSWPGNIRELENVVHSAVLFAAGPKITAADLRLQRSAQSTGLNSPSLDEELRPIIEKYLAAGEPKLFDRLNALLVRTAFDFGAANQLRAAASLGISRNVMRTQLAHAGLIARRARRKAIPHARSDGPGAK